MTRKESELVAMPQCPEILVEQFAEYLREQKYVEATVLQYCANLHLFIQIFKSVNAHCVSVQDLYSRFLFGKTLMILHKRLILKNRYLKKQIKIGSRLNYYISSWNAFAYWLFMQFGGEFEKCRYVRQEQRLPKIIDLSLINQGIDYSSKSWKYWRNVCLLELSAYCGLRSREISQLDITDIDWKNSTIWVSGSLKRAIHIDEIGLNHLKKYIFYRPCTANPALFYSLTGNRINHQYVGQLISSIASRMCGFSVTPRALRHSIACHWYIHTHDVLAITNLLGLRSIRAVLKYAALDLRYMREQLQKTHPRWYRQPMCHEGSIAAVQTPSAQQGEAPDTIYHTYMQLRPAWTRYSLRKSD